MQTEAARQKKIEQRANAETGLDHQLSSISIKGEDAVEARHLDRDDLMAHAGRAVRETRPPRDECRMAHEHLKELSVAIGPSPIGGDPLGAIEADEVCSL